MSDKLLVVEDAFVARGAGVLVMPRFTFEGARAATAPMKVRLVRPDGSSIEATATVDVAHMRGALPPWAMYRLHGVSVAEVPAGTEIWSVV